MTSRDVTNRRDGNNTRPLLTPFTAFRRELDRLFDNFGLPDETRFFGNRTLQPDIELQETDTAYAVIAELPGIEQKDVQVDLKDNILSITGEKRETQQQSERGRHYTERSYGRFERRISLDEEVDADKIEARFSNGVLSVNLPKNPRARDKGRHIEIKAQ